MYTRADISLDDRMEIFSRYWRFQDDHGTVSGLAKEWRISRHFIYDIAERVGNALDWRRAGRREEDRTRDELDAMRRQVRELEAFDWVEVIVAYLEEQFEACDDRRRKVRTRDTAEAAINEVLDLLREVGEINVKPLVTTIEGARVGLFTFLSVLEEKLEKIEIKWRASAGSRQVVYDAVARCWYGA